MKPVKKIVHFLSTDDNAYAKIIKSVDGTFDLFYSIFDNNFNFIQF